MRKLLLLFFLHTLVGGASAQFSITGNRIPHQVIGGVAIGALGGVAGGLSGRLLVADDPTGWEALGAVVAGSFIGYTVGNGYGVYWFGNTETEKGSLAWTLVGSATGLFAGVGLGANHGEALLPIAATSVLIGSMVGYNLTRKSEIAFLRPATGTSQPPRSMRPPSVIPEAPLALVRIRF